MAIASWTNSISKIVSSCYMNCSNFCPWSPNRAWYCSLTGDIAEHSKTSWYSSRGVGCRHLVQFLWHLSTKDLFPTSLGKLWLDVQNWIKFLRSEMETFCSVVLIEIWCWPEQPLVISTQSGSDWITEAWASVKTWKMWNWTERQKHTCRKEYIVGGLCQWVPMGKKLWMTG